MSFRLRQMSAALWMVCACKTAGMQDAAPERGEASATAASGQASLIDDNAKRMVAQGRAIFRDDTFGSEDFFGGELQLHRAIAGQKNGGLGGGVSPKTALSVGLKVDAERVPAPVAAGIKSGAVSLDDPANTLALLKANAVVGVRGVFEGDRLSSLGITCAFCHSTVDDSFAAGIGKRLDGWPNRDLNVGAIVSLSPDLSAFTKLLGVDEATVRKVLASWGPGKFDAELNLDGKAFRPDGKPAATLLPAAFGLAGVNLHTYSGWGSVTYWNAYVANNEMNGKGVFFDPRLDDRSKFPVAARAGFGHRQNAQDDRITSKLAALHFYQLAIPAPVPPEGSFDRAAAGRGKTVFEGRAKCATCHVPPLYTEPGWNMHTGAEIGVDDFQSGRSPDGRYRTTPLKGLFARQKGGFYHDGRFANYAAVIDHYDGVLRLGLDAREKADLQEFLKSL
jgi:hypothetical protein